MLTRVMNWLALGILLYPFAAYGYIDPGSGALMWQLVLALGIGMLFYVRWAWRSVKKFGLMLAARKSKAARHLSPEMKKAMTP